MKYLLFALLISMAHATFCQAPDEETIKKKTGAELKAMAIGGGTTFGLVTGWALLYNSSMAREDRIDAVMVPGAGLALAIPASLVSAGLGYLVGSHHADFTGGFSVGLGWAMSSIDRRVSQAQAAKDWYHGLEIRVGTPRIGPVRYMLTYNRYATYDYITFDEPAESTYWEFNINMQYVLGGEVIEVYPFLGSNLFFEHNVGTYFYDGDRYNETFSDLGFNVGLGMSVRISDHWSIYTEPKLVVSEEESQWFFSLGSQYEF